MKRALIAVLLAVAMLPLAGCGIAIPDVRGMTVTQAEDSLKAAGFTVGKVVYNENAVGALGAVVTQTPSAGEAAKKGALVVLIVAGSPPVPTPNLIGLSRDKAGPVLTTSGLVLGAVSESFNSSVAAGTVTSQTPPPMVDAPRGSAVAIEICGGSKPETLPSVKGRTLTDASKLLGQLGFRVKSVSKPDKAKKGIVIGQKPDSGTAPPGSEVVITVSSGEASDSASQQKALLDAARRVDGYHGSYKVLELHVSGDWAIAALTQTSGDQFFDYYAWHLSNGVWKCRIVGAPTSDYAAAAEENARSFGIPTGLLAAMEWPIKPSWRDPPD